ncbi:MAG: hypothetical protein JNL11_06140 [Bdellovibrionaceae bacterium]|nr:hypothetical protein [Pseudobdellovibrionaceae bacterium]
MKRLKNSILFTLLCVFNSACQSTGGYKIKTFHIENQDFQVVQVSPSRIRQECLFLNAEEEGKWRHQYLMLLLNDKNEAIEIAHPHNMDIDSCREQIVHVEKILRIANQAFLCARDSLKKKSAVGGSWQDQADFGPLGIHPVKYDSLTFDTICNSEKCYGDNSAYTYTCPGFTKQ